MKYISKYQTPFSVLDFWNNLESTLTDEEKQHRDEMARVLQAEAKAREDLHVKTIFLNIN